ncbi:MAG: hypothetical protein WD535_05615 [Thermaerobacterales bacterium]
MKDLLSDEFQDAVGECLIRHRSILDIVSKFQETNARVNRAVLKAATSCGCVTINASKPEIPSDISLEQLRDHMKSHLEGELCESCREVLEDEIGKHLFFTTALANAFDLNLYDILLKEHKKLNTLGIFNAS